MSKTSLKVASYIPPANVARNARRALEVRQSKPESQRGMTPVGIARASQLANRRPVSIDTIKRMVAYFDRHEVDKQGSTWDEEGKGWQAWMGWGGDAGRTWARTILQKENTMATKAELVMPDMTEMSPEEILKMKLEMMVALLYDIAGVEVPEAEMEDEESAEDIAEDTAEAAAEVVAEDETKVDLTAEERDAMPDEDFAIPSTRNFPINSPVAVSDAVAGWGRYEGDVSFEEFKRNLIAIAKRKGAEYVAALPQSWKDEMAEAEANKQEAVKALARQLLERLG